MRKLLIILGVGLLGLTSCNKEETVTKNTETYESKVVNCDGDTISVVTEEELKEELFKLKEQHDRLVYFIVFIVALNGIKEIIEYNWNL